jgi:hypothetical protein
MKKILFLALALFALSACKTSQTIKTVVGDVQTYVEKHCPVTAVINPITTDTLGFTFKCDSLWPTQAVQNSCGTANICVDVANGTISGNIACNSPVNVANILSALPLKSLPAGNQTKSKKLSGKASAGPK